LDVEEKIDLDQEVEKKKTVGSRRRK